MSRHERHQTGQHMTRRVLRGFSPAALRAARNGMSITDLARLARTDRRTLQLWETGRTTPQIDVLRRVCAVLDITIADVIHLDPDRTYPSDLRILAGMTQLELGHAAGLSASTVGMIERGEAEVSAAALDALSTALEVSPATYRAAHTRVRNRPAGEPA